MKVTYTPADLVAFEDGIAALFASGRIRAPVHLAGGNEGQLIRVFEEHVQPQDWVLCSWRSHYHCLLKGVPPEQVRQEILDGRSISLCFPEHRVLSSGIVGGTAPIAVGLAMGIKRKQQEYIGKLNATIATAGLGPIKDLEPPRKVVCFVGDMTAETGAFYEAVKYTVNLGLPVLFVVEDNGLSVSTDTAAVWDSYRYPGNKFIIPEVAATVGKILRYHYKLTRPHVGIGKHVAF